MEREIRLRRVDPHIFYLPKLYGAYLELIQRHPLHPYIHWLPLRLVSLPQFSLCCPQPHILLLIRVHTLTHHSLRLLPTPKNWLEWLSLLDHKLGCLRRLLLVRALVEFAADLTFGDLCVDGSHLLQRR